MRPLIVKIRVAVVGIQAFLISLVSPTEGDVVQTIITMNGVPTTINVKVGDVMVLFLSLLLENVSPKNRTAKPVTKIRTAHVDLAGTMGHLV